MAALPREVRRTRRQQVTFEQRMAEADTPARRLSAACQWLVAVASRSTPDAIEADTQAVLALVKTRTAANLPAGRGEEVQAA